MPIVAVGNSHEIASAYRMPTKRAESVNRDIHRPDPVNDTLHNVPNVRSVASGRVISHGSSTGDVMHTLGGGTLSGGTLSGGALPKSSINSHHPSRAEVLYMAKTGATARNRLRPN